MSKRFLASVIVIVIALLAVPAIADIISPWETREEVMRRRHSIPGAVLTLSPSQTKKNTLILTVEAKVEGSCSYSISTISGDVEEEIFSRTSYCKKGEETFYLLLPTPEEGQVMSFRYSAVFEPDVWFRDYKDATLSKKVTVRNFNGLIHVVIEK